MRKQTGAHPRMGATDVCPFIPVSEVSWEEAIACAKSLGKRVGEELKIPVYLYEKAAKSPARSNLSVIRAGEYEGFFEKIKDPAWKPDFGPAVFNERSGATVIGAREFLVAYNVNLNTRATRRATSVAFDVRENGRDKTEDGTPSGKKVLDGNGEPVREPGMLKHVKAIGWFVEEYGMAQVSMNLTNIDETPLHAAFAACEESAAKRGLRVTGSEVVGMLPKKCLTDAGRYFLRRQGWSEGASEEELIDLAIRSMGLSEVKPFVPNEKVIELKIATEAKKSLVQMNLRQFCHETLSDSPAPGGGSVAALLGALGASLGGMVANLSAGKRGWDDRLEFFSSKAVEAQELKDELLRLVDEDTAAFNRVMAAFGLPKDSAEEKTARSAAIQAANKYAAEIPLLVMETALKSYPLLQAMAVDAAMLDYLDNDKNVASSPNENFGRELMELFTLGNGQFSEADVVAMARAWTGHGTSNGGTSYQFLANKHDNANKTLFGITRPPMPDLACPAATWRRSAWSTPPGRSATARCAWVRPTATSCGSAATAPHGR